METFTQRRTAASTTGVDKPAGARSSVFDNGGQATRRRPYVPFDPATLVIRKNVPMPAALQQRTSGALALLQRMAKGDSVELPERQVRTLQSAAKKAGIKIATRKLQDGQFGLWKL